MDKENLLLEASAYLNAVMYGEEVGKLDWPYDTEFKIESKSDAITKAQCALNQYIKLNTDKKL